MQKKSVYSLIMGLFFCGALSLIFILYRVNEGFSIKKIVTNLPYPSSDISTSDGLNSEIKEALNQPYYYLSRGGQAFVFESKDKKYVMKFFRYDRLRPSFFWKLKTLFVNDEITLLKKEKRFRETMKSYDLSFKELHKITGVIYTHLKKTNHICLNVTLFDNSGKSYFINLDRMGFILQKRAKLMGTVLDEYLEQKNIDKIKEIIVQYFKTLRFHADQGIFIKDHNSFFRNYGFVGDDLLEIDVGNYRKEEKDFDFYVKDNRDHYQSFQYWLTQKIPSLVSYFDEQSHKILDQ